MNNNSLQKVLLLSSILACTSVLAEGFVPLPNTGFQVGNGDDQYISSYTLCNLTGEFGIDEEGSTPPTFGANGAHNTCAIDKIPEGYTQINSVSRKIVLSTLNKRNRPTKVTVGVAMDRVWRNSQTSSCLYGVKIRLNNVDADPRRPSKQYFEINDIVRGGFDGQSPEIAYWYTANADEVVYRAGLTFTSLVFDPATESDAQPPVAEAAIDANWINFSTDLNYRDEDGSSFRDSPWLLVKGMCGADETFKESEGALRFRQMGQEDQPQIEIPVKGFAPAAADTSDPSS